MEKKNVKKPVNKTLSLAEAKELVRFMKKENVSSFSYGDLAVNFHPLAFTEVNINSGQNTHKTDDKQPDPINDDPLFDAVE